MVQCNTIQPLIQSARPPPLRALTRFTRWRSLRALSLNGRGKLYSAASIRFFFPRSAPRLASTGFKNAPV
jgi:hypothetical protein